MRISHTSVHLAACALLPPMPVQGLAVLTDSDLKAMFAYLRSVQAISNPVPAPLPPR